MSTKSARTAERLVTTTTRNSLLPGWSLLTYAGLCAALGVLPLCAALGVLPLPSKISHALAYLLPELSILLTMCPVQPRLHLMGQSCARWYALLSGIKRLPVISYSG
jgi:hypothetical protein